MEFIKKYRKFFALYFAWVILMLFWLIGEDSGRFNVGTPPLDVFTLFSAPAFIFLLYLAFKKPTKK